MCLGLPNIKAFISIKSYDRFFDAPDWQTQLIPVSTIFTGYIGEREYLPSVAHVLSYNSTLVVLLIPHTPDSSNRFVYV